MAAVPMGIAAWVATNAVLMAAFVPFNPITGFLCTLFLIGAGNFLWKRILSLHELASFSIGAAIVLLAAAFLAAHEWIIFNSDAYMTFYMADDLIYNGFLSDQARKVPLGAEPIYLPLVSAFFRSMGEPYFASLSSLMALCGAVLFAVFGARVAAGSEAEPDRIKAWIFILGAVALTTNGFYINTALQSKTHGVFALHMLCACASLYLAARESRPEWFVLALFFMAAMPLFRLESGTSAFPILVVAVAISSIPLKIRLLGVGTVSVLWGLSYLYLLGATTYFDGFQRGLVAKNLIGTGGPVGLFGVGLLAIAFVDRRGLYQSPLNRLLSWVPSAMVAALLAILAWHIVTRPEIFRETINGILSILLEPSMGGLGFGVAVGVLFLLSFLFRARLPSGWILAVPIASYLIVVALADFHLEGQPHWGQTGALTRILSHVMPTLMFYVVWRLVFLAKQPHLFSGTSNDSGSMRR